MGNRFTEMRARRQARGQVGEQIQQQERQRGQVGLADPSKYVQDIGQLPAPGMPGTPSSIMGKYGIEGTASPFGGGGALAGGMDNVSARQGLVGPTQLKLPMAGRPVGVATGMGMTPPSQGAFNPTFNMMNRGGPMPFSRERADGIIKKYGMAGV